ncbi:MULTISPECIES: RNA polymerase sigma factor [Lactobacillaceae]|uniref:RNA polymerase sigma factor n=1 Tax=Lactobacillaceae TaxID=33958 RepID=UPI00145655A5|nr:RNA polymerase sigma factor [Lactobacillus sp. HBUAS51381]NLR08766.1 RNA polymerase sigma factor [Lactobacillus sp. HBUAS51381]
MQLKAYEDWLAELTQELQRYLVGRGAQREVAEDICQDVFVKVLEMELVLPPAELRPYLYRVAWSTYLDHYRRTRRYRELVTRYIRPTGVVNPPLMAENPVLVRALRRLSPRECHLLVLRYAEDRPIREVAVQLGISSSAVKMRLQRVQRKLEKIMRRDQDERE